MNRYDYTYGVAYIRAIENRLLTSQDFEALIACSEPQDALRILNDKYSSDVLKPENFEELLSSEMEKAWDEVRYASPKGAPLDFLLYGNDFHNFKVAVKGVKTGIKDYDKYVVSPATIEFTHILRAVEKADFSLLPKMLENTARHSYDILLRTDDSQLFDTIVDKASMDYMYKAALDTKSDFLKGYVRLINTYKDIKIAVRCAVTSKNADFLNMALSDNSSISRSNIIEAALSGIDALKEFLTDAGYAEAVNALDNSMQAFEKYSDDAVSDYLKKASGISFGVEPLVAYINRKQTEIRNVRIIMSAKLNGFDDDVIRSRMRS